MPSSSSWDIPPLDRKANRVAKMDQKTMMGKTGHFCKPPTAETLRLTRATTEHRLSAFVKFIKNQRHILSGNSGLLPFGPVSSYLQGLLLAYPLNSPHKPSDKACPLSHPPSQNFFSWLAIWHKYRLRTGHQRPVVEADCSFLIVWVSWIGMGISLPRHSSTRP